jgi:photosystem II stability/assembly factor-like uncharacterized protein
MGISLQAYSQFTVVPTGTTTDITDIVKHSDTIIISGKNNYFAKSYDFGQSIVNFSVPGLSGGYNFDFQITNDIYYMISGIGFPIYQSQILKSQDLGSTWQILNDTSSILFTTLTMVDTTYGILAGLYGSYLSANGSDSTWIYDTLDGSTYLSAYASGKFGDSTMLILTIHGAAMSTIDRGQTWYWGYCKDAVHQKLQFINEDTVYSISHESSGTIAYFSKSINGGHNFSTITLGPNFGDSTYYGTYFDTQIFDFHFDTPQHGYIVGYNSDLNEGVIFETNDYGQNWTVCLTGFNETLYSLLYVDDSTAFIGGSNGLLLKWNPLQVLSPVGMNENPNNGFLFTLFPNPANKTITIKHSLNDKNIFITISNSLGEVVYTSQMQSYLEEISTENIRDGLYFVNIKSNNQNSTRKLIISH